MKQRISSGTLHSEREFMVQPSNDTHDVSAAAAPTPSHNRRRHWWLLPLAASTFILVMYWNRSSPQPLTLKAEAYAPGEVRIEWTSSATPFPNGSKGSLEIRDGDRDLKISLDAG